MIRIGLDDEAKSEVVRRYIRDHGITKVFVVSPERFAPTFASTKVTEPDQVDGQLGRYIAWPEHTFYRFYYRVIQGADASTLLVLNEVLRGQHRTSLNFNCIRTFLRHAPHRIVFQYLPIVDSVNDVMTLVDFETGSKWWGQPFAPEMIAELDIEVIDVPIEVVPVPVHTDVRTAALYAQEKAEMLAMLRTSPDKDPHLLPRNLLLVSGRDKARAVVPGRRYVGRNNRFGLDRMETFRASADVGQRVVFELPHNAIDLSDHLTIARSPKVEVLVADTKADRWYFERFRQWAGRVRDASAALHR